MKSITRVAAVLAGLALVTATSVGFAPTAFASYASTPVGPTGWTPDGPVHAVVTVGDRVIVGGAFTGGVAALNASTGALEWTASANGGVRALAVSSDGTRVIAGGAFLSLIHISEPTRRTPISYA